MKKIIFLLMISVSFLHGWAQKDTLFIKNMKDYKDGYINVLVSPSGRKSVVTEVDAKNDWISGDKFTIESWEFIITDSTGWVAKRDSAGRWHIKDCKRALEIMYEMWRHERTPKEEEYPLKIRLHNQEN